MSCLKESNKVVMKCNEENHWEPTVVVDKHSSPRSYIVRNNNGHICRHNRKHIHETKAIFKNYDLEEEEFEFEQKSTQKSSCRDNGTSGISSY